MSVCKVNVAEDKYECPRVAFIKVCSWQTVYSLYYVSKSILISFQNILNGRQDYPL